MFFIHEHTPPHDTTSHSPTTPQTNAPLLSTSTHAHMVPRHPGIAWALLLLIAALLVVAARIAVTHPPPPLAPATTTEPFDASTYITADETSVQNEIQILRIWTTQVAKSCGYSGRSPPQSSSKMTSADQCQPINTVTGALLLNDNTRLAIGHCVMNALPMAEQMVCSASSSSSSSLSSLSSSGGGSLHNTAANG